MARVIQAELVRVVVATAILIGMHTRFAGRGAMVMVCMFAFCQPDSPSSSYAQQQGEGKWNATVRVKLHLRQ